MQRYADLTEAPVPTGLRERKKRRTRDRIVAVARELFSERGYQNTSLADVAERADIAVSTLFGYFDNKGDLFFAGYPEIIDDFVETITTRPPGETGIDAAIRWHRERRPPWLGADPDSAEMRWWRDRRRIIDAEPALEGLEHMRYARANEALARAVAEDLGDSEGALRPQLIAATKVALLITLGRYLSHADFEPAEATAYDEYVCRCLEAAADAIAAIPVPAAPDR